MGVAAARRDSRPAASAVLRSDGDTAARAGAGRTRRRRRPVLPLPVGSDQRDGRHLTGCCGVGPGLGGLPHERHDGAAAGAARQWTYDALATRVGAAEIEVWAAGHADAHGSADGGWAVVAASVARSRRDAARTRPGGGAAGPARRRDSRRSD